MPDMNPWTKFVICVCEHCRAQARIPYEGLTLLPERWRYLSLHGRLGSYCDVCVNRAIFAPAEGQ